MDFFGRRAVGALDLRTNAPRVAGRALQANPNPRARAGVFEEANGGAVLADAEVDAAIVIEITNSRPALFTINPYAALRRGQGVETPLTVTQEPETPAGIR